MKKLGFGLMRLPLTDPGDQTSVDLDLFKEMADRFLAEGFSYFDTAYVYHDGMSERAFKEAVVDRHPRDSYTLTDKMLMRVVETPEDVKRVFNEQLERTGLTYFDYYWMHNMTSASYRKATDLGAIDFVLEQKEKGYFKHFGISFHDTPEMLDKILNEHPEIEFVQMQLNYLDWLDPGIQSGACYAVAREHGKKVMVMEPCKGGNLANLPEKAAAILKEAEPDASLASWAIRYAASLEGVEVVLSGMSDLAQVEDNISYMADFEPLSGEERMKIAQIVDIIHESITIPCTACRYCVPGCPMQIPIPVYFSLYNRFCNMPTHMINKNANSQKMYYGNYVAAGAGKASDCIGCRQCEGACPQHIPVTEWLPKIAEAFEG